jgi:hypothetical protein
MGFVSPVMVCIAVIQLAPALDLEVVMSLDSLRFLQARDPADAIRSSTPDY